MKTYSRYKNVKENVKDLYSKQKYGDIKSINYFANLLYELIITKRLITDRTVLFVGVKYPYSDKYKKNFVILTEKISRLSKLPTVYAFYRYEYNALAAIRGLSTLGCKALCQEKPKVVDFKV